MMLVLSCLLGHAWCHSPFACYVDAYSPNEAADGDMETIKDIACAHQGCYVYRIFGSK